MFEKLEETIYDTLNGERTGNKGTGKMGLLMDCGGKGNETNGFAPALDC